MHIKVFKSVATRVSLISESQEWLGPYSFNDSTNYKLN